jgi:hypothetical protein
MPAALVIVTNFAASASTSVYFVPDCALIPAYRKLAVVAMSAPTDTAAVVVIGNAVPAARKPSVERTSAFVADGSTDGGHAIALNGTAGMSAPCPDPSTKLVPVVAGEGAVATVAYAKFA